MGLWYLSHRRPAKAQANLRSFHKNGLQHLKHHQVDLTIEFLKIPLNKVNI